MSFWDYFAKDPEVPREQAAFWEYFAPCDPPDPGTLESVQATPSAVNFNEKRVFWAMRNLPIREAVKHFLVCGAIGTGKTTTIDLFLQSIAPRFHSYRRVPEQLIIFDAKCEIIPKLAALGYSLDDPNSDEAGRNVWLLNPYDERSCVWNIAEAVQSPLMARHFAALLVPEEKGSNAPFFWSASRRLVHAVILALTRIAGTRWHLRDLLCALESRERIATITARHPRAKVLADSILSDTQHSSGVISSLATKIGHLEEVAALWHSAPVRREFSIANFLKRPGVLIIGNDPVLRESLWPINAMLLKSLSQEILRRPDVDGPRHWFVLDEFPAMEKVESIHDLVNRGRSKGASVLIGLQGIDRLNELYKETGANDLLEQCSNKTFFRAGGPKTAEWIERFFGKYRRREATYTESWSGKNRSGSIQYQMAERSVFQSSYFLNLPSTGPGLPIVSVNDVPSMRSTLITVRQFDEINAWRIRPDENVPALLARDDVADQSLQPWDEVEVNSFCAEGPSMSSEPAAESKAKSSRRRLPKRDQRFPKPPPRRLGSGEP